MESVRSCLVFDLETSGLNPDRDRIIQVGMCSVSNGELDDRAERLVRQDVRIDPEAATVHGITVKDTLARGIPPRDSLVRSVEAMRSAPVRVDQAELHRASHDA
ncbi:MAG: exonuclease domain-containing protein [Phycisphaerae bacterium]